jgi:LDH2 family malate/lactate/ureidoglycolate dehydrogenase
MLDRFHVPKADQVRVSEAALRRCVTEIFISCGVSPEDAADGADVLVWADLRGVETHGVSNMMRQYVTGFQNGDLNPRPALTLLREKPASASFDGDRGLGILQGKKAMQVAIEKARNVGVGVVTIRNSAHLGAVGHFAMQAANEGLIGVCMTSISKYVLPTFGAEPRLGTNPISIAAPAQSQPYFIFDAATSTISGNKIGLARRVGANIEPGWIAEADGTPIMEVRPVPPGERYALMGHNLLPLGGTREQGSHKGYGLALMVETLTTLLAGGVPNMVKEQHPYARHHFAAYDIAAFCDPDEFKETMDAMLQTLAATPPAPGHARVVYPGLPEHETELDRRANGIPLHREVIDWFNGCTDSFGLPCLETI